MTMRWRLALIPAVMVGFGAFSAWFGGNPPAIVALQVLFVPLWFWMTQWAEALSATPAARIPLTRPFCTALLVRSLVWALWMLVSMYRHDQPVVAWLLTWLVAWACMLVLGLLGGWRQYREAARQRSA